VASGCTFYNTGDSKSSVHGTGKVNSLARSRPTFTVLPLCNATEPTAQYIGIQEGLAVASIARDDPSPLPGMHRDHNALPSQTDGQTDGY